MSVACRARPCYLAISVHAIVADNASRDILLTDIFTAFGQRLAGEDIALQPVTTSWREWSQRCAALATHSAVVESRDFWLDTVTAAARRVVGSEVVGTAGGRRPCETVLVVDCFGNKRDRRRATPASVADRGNPAGRAGPDDRGHRR